MATGVVSEWHDHGGYGTVLEDASGTSYFFHCTQLLDGSRTTKVGERVTFEVTPGRLGRWEAIGIAKIDPSEHTAAER